MKTTIEKSFPRCEEVADYYKNRNDFNIHEIKQELKYWFGKSDYIIGNGGYHVWMSERETGERVLLITA
jgi:hypothetical protein